MNTEKIIETKFCEDCGLSFNITDKDLEFYDKISPTINGKKYTVNHSDYCPTCREQMRLAWRNERKLYKRKCDITGKDIISIFSPDKVNKVYHYDEWKKDGWNPLDYGFEYNFNKDFFEQFRELLVKVPLSSLFIGTSENCDYNNLIEECKNCYMCFDSAKMENTLFSENSVSIFGSMEVTWSNNVNHSYEIVDSANIYNSFYCNSSSNLDNCYFCNSCNNCSDCFLCSGINNKKYHILNKEYLKDEYKEKVEELKAKNDYIEFCKKFFGDFNLKIPKKQFKESGNENCLGSNIFDSKDLYKSFNVVSANNFRYVDSGGRTNDVFDGNIVYDGEGKIYNSLNILGSYNIINSVDIINSREILHSFYLYNCMNCFGCVGLTSKQYCIFNKQYTSEEYFDIVPNIIENMNLSGEWGKFFPKNISIFGYNESVANEYYPLKKQEAIEKGFNWSDYEAPFPKVEKIISANKLPNNIEEIPNDILNWAIECEVTRKPFRIIKEELDFYRKYNLSIPRRHPDQRYLERLKIRGGKEIFDRRCDKCNKQIQSIYIKNAKEIVYCLECYNKEFY